MSDWPSIAKKRFSSMAGSGLAMLWVELVLNVNKGKFEGKRLYYNSPLLYDYVALYYNSPLDRTYCQCHLRSRKNVSPSKIVSHQPAHNRRTIPPIQVSQ